MMAIRTLLFYVHAGTETEHAPTTQNGMSICLMTMPREIRIDRIPTLRNPDKKLFTTFAALPPFAPPFFFPPIASGQKA